MVVVVGCFSLTHSLTLIQLKNVLFFSFTIFVPHHHHQHHHHCIFLFFDSCPVLLLKKNLYERPGLVFTGANHFLLVPGWWCFVSLSFTTHTHCSFNEHHSLVYWCVCVFFQDVNYYFATSTVFLLLLSNSTLFDVHCCFHWSHSCTHTHTHLGPAVTSISLTSSEKKQKFLFQWFRKQSRKKKIILNQSFLSIIKL